MGEAPQKSSTAPIVIVIVVLLLFFLCLPLAVLGLVGVGAGFFVFRDKQPAPPAAASDWGPMEGETMSEPTPLLSQPAEPEPQTEREATP
jgi:flagellar basal body-associated protein FliL